MQWILRLQNWLRLESYKKMFHTLREKTGSLSATGGVLCRRHPSAGAARRSAVCRDRSGISQPNATYKVNNLAAKGYLEKIPGEDRREVRLQTAGKFNAYYTTMSRPLREAGMRSRAASPRRSWTRRSASMPGSGADR